jgi:2-C-methyl-D-erythritol 4-phosphate cytidylyltransferase/2-C-methyl-D-erythritol 2,4-cyclodiphosphate synthase
MTVSVIIAAGGHGTRLGGGVPKQWLAIGGTSLLERSIAAFDAHPRVSEIVVVVPSGSETTAMAGTMKARRVVTGGPRRQDSVAEGFAAVSADAAVVLVHDAARPFVTADVIDRAIDGALAKGAVVPAVPVHDTVKQIAPASANAGIGTTSGAGASSEIEDARVIATLPRETLFLAQTPQGFRREILAAAIDAGRRGASGTDEAMLAEQAGHEVHLVAGDAANVKITTAADLERARARSTPPAFRIGTGYDLHVFVERRPLLLGGVRIPYDRGLKGHSDADAVCHAITDAILGAANLGDIGRLFPDTDPRYKDADSLRLLADAAGRVRDAGWQVVNVDVVVIAERPKIGPHVPAMQRSLAATLGVDAEAIAIKGKTNEGVDATGRGEALAVHAVALIARTPS